MPKKIVFMGTPMFAVPILKSLYQNGYPISIVYTQPPQKSKRGQKINKSPIQGISETLNIDFRTPTILKGNKEEYDFIKREYESFLFRKNKPSTFRDVEGVSFSGIIKNVSSSGSLQVLIEDDIIKEFDLKDVSLLY